MIVSRNNKNEEESKQKKINENYANNIALFTNDYVEILVEITGVPYFIRP